MSIAVFWELRTDQRIVTSDIKRSHKPRKSLRQLALPLPNKISPLIPDFPFDAFKGGDYSGPSLLRVSIIVVSLFCGFSKTSWKCVGGRRKKSRGRRRKRQLHCEQANPQSLEDHERGVLSQSLSDSISVSRFTRLPIQQHQRS